MGLAPELRRFEVLEMQHDVFAIDFVTTPMGPGSEQTYANTLVFLWRKTLSKRG